jgi:hypothetical protein
MSLATASRSWVEWGMLDYVIILLVGLLGYEGAGWWVILIGAAALTFEMWFKLYEMLWHRQAVQLGWQDVLHFTAAFSTNITACSASYLVGYFGHTITG